MQSVDKRKRASRWEPMDKFQQRKRLQRRKLQNMQFNGLIRRTIFGKQSLKTTHRYCTRVSINPGLSGATGAHTFTANGMYDPDITGTGHQPIGFDEMVQFYEHYTVIASKIRVLYENTDSNNGVVAIAVTQQSTIGTDLELTIERGQCVYKQLNSTQDGNGTELTHQVNVKKFMGRPNILSEDDLRGTSSSNPADQVYFVVAASPVDSSVDMGAINCFIQIDYIAVWTEPKGPPQS